MKNNFDKSDNAVKTLVINEIVARAEDGGNDWVELYNAGEYALFLHDYALIDDNTEREPVFLPDILLNPAEFIVIQATDEPPEDGSYYVPFKLGADDKLMLYWGLTIVDILDWSADEAPSGYSFGRFPDGVGEPRTLMPTPGLTNKEILQRSLVINEIVASPSDQGSDWIELYNTSEKVIDLKEYSIVDDNAEREPVALPDRLLGPHEFIVILATDETPEDDLFVPFRLGDDDSVTLYYGPDIMDTLDWEDGDAPDGYSFGRFPDGAKTVCTLTPTPGQANKQME